MKWNATNELGQSVSGGVYFYKIQVGQVSETKNNFVEIRKVLLQKNPALAGFFVCCMMGRLSIL